MSALLFLLKRRAVKKKEGRAESRSVGFQWRSSFPAPRRRCYWFLRNEKTVRIDGSMELIHNEGELLP